MLQQTQVKTVVPYFERWMRAFPTVEKFARGRPEKVLKLWEGLGYYSRVRNAQAAAKLILERHDGKFPSDFDDVLALPGVGRYTAGAICSIAFHQPVPILDGNVIRVLSRLFGIGGDPHSKAVNAILWETAEKLVSVKGIDPSALNQALMELGALVCLPQQPKCPACPVRSECFAFREQRVAEFPALPQRARATARRFMALVARREGQFLVQQREAGVVNGGLWEFPNFEIALEAQDLAELCQPFKISSTEPFFSVRHSITRYRILLEAFHAELPANSASVGEWKTVKEIKKIALTSAHRKVFNNLSLIFSVR